MSYHNLAAGIVTLLSIFSFFHLPAHAWDRSTITPFATLPEGSAHPEGMATDAKGNFYVSTWDLERRGQLGHVIVFAPDGTFQRRIEVANSSNRLGELRFLPGTSDLVVVDYGGKQVLKVNPMTGESALFISVPVGEKPEPPTPRTSWSAPNGIVFDKKGNVYFTDSYQGTVWKTGPAGGVATPWVKNDLLISHGFPSLGANGIAFNRAEDTLFVGNTGDDVIIRIPVVNDEAGKPEVFVYSVNGPDGMFIDEEDRLWVAAAQSDEIVVLDKTGKLIAKLGDFKGLDEKGAPRGLLWPSEPMRVGDFLYVANLVIDVRDFKVAQTPIAQYAKQVKIHNIVRMPIPPSLK